MGSSDELMGAEGPRSVGTQQLETKKRNSWKSNAAVQRVSGVLQPVTHTRTPSVCDWLHFGSYWVSVTQHMIPDRHLRNGECRCFYISCVWCVRLGAWHKNIWNNGSSSHHEGKKQLHDLKSLLSCIHAYVEQPETFTVRAHILDT